MNEVHAVARGNAACIVGAARNEFLVVSNGERTTGRQLHEQRGQRRRFRQRMAFAVHDDIMPASHVNCGYLHWVLRTDSHPNMATDPCIVLLTTAKPKSLRQSRALAGIHDDKGRLSGTPSARDRSVTTADCPAGQAALAC